MKDTDIIAHKQLPSATSAQERDGDHYAIEPASPLSGEALPSSHVPKPPLCLPLHRRLWLLLMLMVMALLIILAGGYTVFRTGSLLPGQASPAFQQVHCPFPIGAGLIEGQNVRCGELTVPEDRSHP